MGREKRVRRGKGGEGKDMGGVEGPLYGS